jgi:ABC-type dipeptide/oligopeptide/nickel transport system permease component
LIRYAGRRALHAVPVLFAITLVSFLLIHLVPGDPARIMLGTRATDQQIAELREQLGLDRPLPTQYLSFVGGAVRLDFRESYVQKAPVRTLLWKAVGPTVGLVIYALLISLLIAVPLALFSAARADRTPDHVIRVLMMVAFAMPAFWVGLFLVLIFSIKLGWFPTSGLGSGPAGVIQSLTLPAVTIALYLSPLLVRTLRGSMVETLGADHVEASRSRGLPEHVIWVRHVFRSSLLAMITLIGVTLGYLLAGTVVVETVFAIPGLGSLLVKSVAARDFPLVQGVVVVFGVAVLLINLAADMINASLDPRIEL